LCLRISFVLYWRKTVGAKAAHRTLVKMTPEQQGSISPTFYEQLLPQYSCAKKYKPNIASTAVSKTFIGKAARKMLVN
jgi:hypothetical protein